MSDWPQHRELLERIEQELIDGYDEELELEIEDREADLEFGSAATAPDQRKAARRLYFRELFRMQAELAKLQDWVAAGRRKVVVLFEGRDAAGKGGVIK